MPLLNEVEEIEFIEPTGYFEYRGVEYPYWGNLTGSTKTVDYEKGKFNRYAKLGDTAENVIKELSLILKKLPNKAKGRAAYASLIMLRYGIRTGNKLSAEGYESGLEKNKGEIVRTFGITTLLNRHVVVKDDRLILNFLGKEQVRHNIIVKDKLLVKYGKKFHDPNDSDGKWLNINYKTLFKFIQDNIGNNFVPKDLRTFRANITAWRHIKKLLKKPPHKLKSDAKSEVAEVVEVVANRLGNTTGVAKSSYIDNRMLDWFLAKRWDPEIDESINKISSFIRSL